MSKPDQFPLINGLTVWRIRLFPDYRKFLHLPTMTRVKSSKLMAGLFVDHKTVASLSEPQSVRLGIASSIPFALQIDTKNLITDSDFQLSGYWIDEINRADARRT